MRSALSIHLFFLIILVFLFSCVATINRHHSNIDLLNSDGFLITQGGTFDYGVVLLNQPSSETFTIAFNGGSLELTGSPKVSIYSEDGGHESAFAVTSQPSSPISGGSSETFTIEFTPTECKSYSAYVKIPNNDSDENPYRFQIDGKGVLTITDISISDSSNNDIPNGSGIFDFEKVPISSSKNETFRIHNNSTFVVELTGSTKVNISGSGVSGFSVIDEPWSTINPGSSTSFQIQYHPTISQNYSAIITIPNTSNENPFTFEVIGQVPDIVVIGWIGDGSDGWKSVNGANSNMDFKSFCDPRGVCVDSSGNIYVADTWNNRICKWDGSGDSIGWIGGNSNGWKTLDGAFGDNGSQSFDSPEGVCVDSNGFIYVADTGNHRISKWDSSGNAIGWIGNGYDGWKTYNGASADNDYQSFNSPTGVYVDTNGFIYVADTENHRISKWDSSGNAVGWIGGGHNSWNTYNGSFSSFDYQSFNYPTGICVDSSGNIYVADSMNERVSKWDGNGDAFGWIGDGSDGWNTGSAPLGDDDYQSFCTPDAVFVTGEGYIYVADSGNDRICKWDVAGTAIAWFGGGSNGWKTTPGAMFGDDFQSFWSPYGICVDSAGNVFVADSHNNRISKWND